ncbi:hypothetical protein EYC80_001076 [Monilinia laxa]|uniref:Uncharacterized protein n=1 Tax=Monilinia laxa TaxID=61186 RepID=A0A5N6K846_MONLA|nr:hypothetical protein EYC80_001076 [Monilinia laxa]
MVSVVMVGFRIYRIVVTLLIVEDCKLGMKTKFRFGLSNMLHRVHRVHSQCLMLHNEQQDKVIRCSGPWAVSPIYSFSRVPLPCDDHPFSFMI